MRTLLVTGGAGFIGSNFIRFVLEEADDCRVVNLDALTYAGNLENLQGLDERFGDRYRFVHGNIVDRPFVESLLADVDPDAVVNFAAESHVDRSIISPNVFVETNVLGTATLLHAARKVWPREQWGARRFLQISTDEVYGSLPEDEPGAKFTEQTPLCPHSPYSASKASADMLVQAWHDTYGLPTLITRCSNNFGPYQFPEKLIPLMIRNALHDEPLPVYGDGRNVRDWIYVADHCEALCAVLAAGRPGQTYNIGAGNEMRNVDLVRMLLDALGKPHSLISFVPDRPGHDRRYAIDATKLRDELGCRPSFNFAEKLADTIQWYQQHADWVSHVVSREYQQYYETMYGDR